jgi:hypothetical protein
MIPQVTLQVSEEPEQFLHRMDELLRTESELTVKSKLEFHGEHDHLSVGFSPDSHSVEDLVGMFVYWPEETPRLRIEAMARWEPLFPSYETYVSAIRDLFSKRIKIYNKKYEHRYRLRIPTKESCLPRLPPKLNQKFESFCNLANKNCLHPYDWRRFYEFVVASYSSQPDLTQDAVRYHLHQAGFDVEKCDYLAEAFYRCKDFYIETDWKRRQSYYSG